LIDPSNFNKKLDRKRKRDKLTMQPLLMGNSKNLEDMTNLEEKNNREKRFDIGARILKKLDHLGFLS